MRTSGFTAAEIDTLRGNIAFADNTAALGLDVASGTFTYASDVSGALSVRKYGGGTLQLNGNWSSLGGKLILEGGTISRASGELIVPNIEVRSGTMSAILGGSGTLTKTGPGEMIFSNVNNTFTGGVTVNGGTLNLSQDLDGSSLGSGALTLGNGAIINVGNNTLTTSNPNIWKGGFQMGANATWNINGDITLDGNVNYTRSGTVGQSIHLNGDISDGGNGYSLSLGPGAGGGNTYTLAGNNTFSGGLVSSGSTLRINSATALGTGTVSLPTTKLDNTTANPITLTTNNVQSWNGNIEFVGTRDLNMGTGAVTINNNRTVTVTAGTFTVGGGIGQDTGGRQLIKAGEGTLVLGGDNTYKGTTTVNVGTLLINGNSSTANAAVTVNNTATLGGSGTIGGNVTITANANIAPGNAAVGTLNLGGTLTISAMAGGDGKLFYELGTIAASDRIAVAGTLAIGADLLGFGDFDFTALGGLQNGTYKLITSGAVVSGTLDPTPGSLSGAVGSGTGTLQISDGGTGNDIELAVSGIGAGSPYETWAGPGVLFDADANGDGVSNGMAFLLGASGPNVSALDKLPTVTETAGGLVLTFNCLPVAARGTATLRVAHSTTLASWTATTGVVPDSNVPDGFVSYAVTPGSPLNAVTATIGSGAAAGGKLFGRLQATE